MRPFLERRSASFYKILIYIPETGNGVPKAKEANAWFFIFFSKRAHVSTINPNRLTTGSFLPKLRRNEGKKEGRISCHANTNGPGLLEAKVG